MSEETPVQEVTNPALVQLLNVPNGITIPDMNYQFNYTRVPQPDGIDSKLFSLHYKENQQERWSTSRSLLSERFTVAKTEVLIQQIQSNLNGNVIRSKHFRSDTSVKATFVLSGYNIDIENDSDMDRILFKLVSNIDSGTDIIATNHLSFNVINGFSGNHALQLNFGVLKTLNNPDGTRQEVPVNNVFILDNHTIRLIHDSRLNVSIGDVTNVQRNIANRIILFKSIPFTEETLVDMEHKFAKRFMKRVRSMVNELPNELRSYYYASYILSAVLDAESRVDMEIKLRGYIADRVKRIERIRAEGTIA